MYIRQRHWNICQLVHHLDESISALYLCFFIVNLFFMWNHLISLASPAVDLYLYTIYQAWSLFRQLLRFCLVTSYAVSVSKELKKPLRKVMGLTNKCYDQEARRLQVKCLNWYLMVLHYRFEIISDIRHCNIYVQV